jgi:hypothetical protein
VQLRLERTDLGPTYTIGRLFVDDVFECYTLEDRVRPEGEKVPGSTAIPDGEYEVVITWSPRFKRILPLLVDVENFTGVRIHPGNSDADTEGCILVGSAIGVGGDTLLRSRVAFAALMEKMNLATSAGEDIRIAITDFDVNG